MPQTAITSPSDLLSLVNRHLGHSPWQTVSQRQVDEFARITGDDQWVHVDPVRAAAGPFGGTVVHGHLVLSLLPMLTHKVLAPDPAVAAIYQGVRARFLAPVPVGSAIRVGLMVAAARRAGGADVEASLQVNAESGTGRAVCAAELRVLFTTWTQSPVTERGDLMQRTEGGGRRVAAPPPPAEHQPSPGAQRLGLSREQAQQTLPSMGAHADD